MSDGKILNSWKEIAAYLGRAVRTVQRWERDYRLPVRRPAGKGRSAVMAFSNELTAWLQHANVKERPYVRPTLVVVDAPHAEGLSNRKLALEIAKFNVLTAFSGVEALATARKMDVDGFVVEREAVVDMPAAQLCQELKELYPDKKLFVVAPDGQSAPAVADRVIHSADPAVLVKELLRVFGEPKLT